MTSWKVISLVIGYWVLSIVMPGENGKSNLRIGGRQMKLRSGRILALSLLTALLTGAAFVKSSSLTVDSREEEIARAVEGLRAKLIEQRRDLHMHPELSNREERTSRVIAEKLRALGLDEVRTG